MARLLGGTPAPACIAYSNQAQADIAAPGWRLWHGAPGMYATVRNAHLSCVLKMLGKPSPLKQILRVP